MKKDIKISTKEISSSLKEMDNKQWSKEEYESFISKKFLDKKNIISKPIKKSIFIFDENDKNFVSLDQSIWHSIKNNFFQNFNVLGSIFTKKFFLSGTLLIFLWIPIIIGVLFTNNLLEIVNVYPDGKIPYMGNYVQSFISPLLIITMIFIPTFISSIRSESLIKRLGVYGISKEQFNIIITSLTTLFTFVSSFIIFFPLRLIGQQITESLWNIESIGLTWEKNSVNWTSLIPLYIITIISFTQLGIFLGMKYKGSKSSTILGYLIVFLTSIMTSYQIGGLSKIPTSTDSSHILYQIFRWMFLLTPFTIVVQSLSLCYSTSDSLLNNPSWRHWLIPLGYVCSILMASIPIIFNRKWITFSEIR